MPDQRQIDNVAGIDHMDDVGALAEKFKGRDEESVKVVDQLAGSAPDASREASCQTAKRNGIPAPRAPLAALTQAAYPHTRSSTSDRRRARLSG